MIKYFISINSIDTETNECNLVYSTITNTLPAELNINDYQPTDDANQPADTKPIAEQLRDVITVSNRKLAKSTLTKRKDAIKVLQRFLCQRYGEDKNITVGDLTPDMLLELEEHYIADKDYRDTAANGCACHMRNLQAMVGEIVGKQRASELFRLVRTKPQTTASRALTEEELICFATMPLPQRLEAARTKGLLQFLCMGMPFCDLVRLRKGQLEGAHIRYNRKKTRSPIQLPISQNIRDLFRRLRDEGGNKSDFLLPDLTGCTTETEERTAGSALRKYNRQLNEIGELMGLRMPLTSYTFRHTYATLAVENGVDDGLVSKMMGHSRKEITEIYIRRDQKKIDEMSLKMHRLIFGGSQMINASI